MGGWGGGVGGWGGGGASLVSPGGLVMQTQISHGQVKLSTGILSAPQGRNFINHSQSTLTL